MDIIGKIREIFEEETGEHIAPVHKDDDGPIRSWSAHDLSEEELVDDDWIKENTKELK